MISAEIMARALKFELRFRLHMCVPGTTAARQKVAMEFFQCLGQGRLEAMSDNICSDLQNHFSVREEEHAKHALGDGLRAA